MNLVIHFMNDFSWISLRPFVPRTVYITFQRYDTTPLEKCTTPHISLRRNYTHVCIRGKLIKEKKLYV